MKYWLKLIGTFNEPLPLGDYVHKEEFVDSSIGQDEWIDDGHKIVLYATRHNMVFASANVVSPPCPSGTAWPARVDIRYRQPSRPVKKGIHVNEIADPGHNLILEVQHQSFVPISEDEFNCAETLLAAKA